MYETLSIIILGKIYKLPIILLVLPIITYILLVVLI